MFDGPDIDRILSGVMQFLREGALVKLPPRQQFEARVAINALALVRRELRARLPSEDAELQRLNALEIAGHGLAEKTSELCRKLRDGVITLETPGLAEHLWQTTLEKLSVDQPTYSTYQRIYSQHHKNQEAEK